MIAVEQEIETKQGDGATGLLKGISANYLPVLIEGENDLKNKLIDVRIEKMEEKKLFGCNID